MPRLLDFFGKGRSKQVVELCLIWLSLSDYDRNYQSL